MNYSVSCNRLTNYELDNELMTHFSVHPGPGRPDELLSENRVTRPVLQPYRLSQDGEEGSGQARVGSEPCHPSHLTGTGELFTSY